MRLTFDAVKDKSNHRKHRVSLADAKGIKWDTAMAREDVRRDYGDRRMIAIGYIGLRLQVAVYVDRGDERRMVSLRWATAREVSAMPKLWPGTYTPTSEEDEAIARGIAADPDTDELTATDIRKMRPVKRPRVETPKVQLTIRVDQDVVDAFKAAGPGWQTRMNDALREWLKDR